MYRRSTVRPDGNPTHTGGFLMWFLMLGLVGVALKYFEVGYVATLNWWIVLIPFGLALAWWSWADASGYTKRRVVEKDEKRRLDRIERQRSNLGMLTNRSKRGRK
jgi:small Trp-rich protein